VNATFQEALEALYGRERRKDKLGLDGTLALMRALGEPQQRFRSVHVAGTNGKGSVCALVERVLREAGHRTGLFTSPHLVDFRERIRVAGRWADRRWLERRLAHLQSLPQGRDRTFFEIATALAFEYFATRRVEIAVVEVGLGGRLDCTNVVVPEVAAITSIALDHTEILGDTLEKIAAEKAGIVKEGVPVVINVPERPARQVVEWQAARVRATVVPVTRVWTHVSQIRGGRARRWSELDASPWNERLRLRVSPSFQPENIATAVEVLAGLRGQGWKISATALKRGLEKARWPGRFEPCRREPRLWWDGAHNPAAIRGLIAQWLAHHDRPPAVIVLALSRDKDAAAILGLLRDGFPGARLVATRTRSERAADFEILGGLAAVAGFAAETAPDIVNATYRALASAGPDGRVLVTGSLFAVGEAMAEFGGAPGERA
jgi:dihydrofolate synthase/folylpolyglutamate synthase